MDNGVEVFAKLPNPCAGPAQLTVASEVATRCFLRDVLQIPSPKIVSWSSDSNNTVGAEYILEERASGQPLGSLWYDWPMKKRAQLIEQVVTMERQLTDMTLNALGCIYFDSDMQGANPVECNPPLPASQRNRFVMGPLVSEHFWREGRSTIDLNRGPYSEPVGFLKSLGENELKYVKLHDRARMNYHRSSTDPQLPEEAVSLIERYLQVVNCLIPPKPSEDTHSARLWHPDLHLDNIFVDNGSGLITNIIDWQGASVMPLYHQCGIARAFEHPGTVLDTWAVSGLPENYSDMSQEEKQKVDVDRLSETAHKYYQSKTCTNNPAHWAAMQLENLALRRKLPEHVVGIWEGQSLFFARRALIKIVETWDQMCPQSSPCPIKFSDLELAMHAREEENMDGVLGLFEIFVEKWALPVDGMVDPTEYDETVVAINHFRDKFIESAEDADERLQFTRLWPYQDGDRHGLCDDTVGSIQ